MPPVLLEPGAFSRLRGNEGRKADLKIRGRGELGSEWKLSVSANLGDMMCCEIYAGETAGSVHVILLPGCDYRALGIQPLAHRPGSTSYPPLHRVGVRVLRV